MTKANTATRMAITPPSSFAQNRCLTRIPLPT